MGKSDAMKYRVDEAFDGLSLDDLFSFSSDHMALIDRDFKILWVNQKTEETFGPGARGRKCHLVFQGSKSPCKPNCHVAQAFADGKPHTEELSLGTGERRRYYQGMASVARRDQDGVPEAVMEICRDITNQKRLTAALMESEKLLAEDLRFKNAVLAAQQENSLDAILILDKNGGVLSCNQRFIDMLDLPVEGAVIPSIQQVSEAFQRLGDHSDQIGFNKEFFEQPAGKIRDEIQCLDGRILDRYCAPMSSVTGDYCGLVCYFRDITRQKETERKLQDRAREIEEANISMKLLLRQTVDARQEMEERIAANIRNLIMPSLNDLEVRMAGTPEKAFVDAVKENILHIASAFSRELCDKLVGLTPRETQVVNLIRQGHVTKDIARLLGVSLRTIEFYRESVRRKLGIRNKKVNLQAYLGGSGKTTRFF